jgi:hypothetical protein
MLSECNFRFNLLGKSQYSDRQYIINVADELFSEWVTEYRTSVTQLDNMDV